MASNYSETVLVLFYNFLLPEHNLLFWTLKNYWGWECIFLEVSTDMLLRNFFSAPPADLFLLFDTVFWGVGWGCGQLRMKVICQALGSKPPLHIFLVLRFEFMAV